MPLRYLSLLKTFLKDVLKFLCKILDLDIMLCGSYSKGKRERGMHDVRITKIRVSLGSSVKLAYLLYAESLHKGFPDLGSQAITKH